MEVRYDADEDILMIILDYKKGQRIDDTHEMDYGYVSVDQKGNPLAIEIFRAKKFFEKESRVLPREIKQKFFASS
ncbi:MAG: DUF2283 domain-containing protein [Candidatus Levybacteria bacterium]|nr:DUF2283 domain-containing protein [Candidatus Levybacteria bacterium]